ncbi:MAG: Ig-like domain-containing protein [Cyclobacteriaceae bacterium]
MKQRITNLTGKGMAIFFTLFMSVSALHAQILSDDFDYTGTDVTAESTGSGWTGNWSYSGGATSGVDVGDGYLYSTSSEAVSVVRYPSAPVANNDTDTVWYSFLAEKTASGSFSLKGHRISGSLSRFGFHIYVDGGIGGAPAAASPSAANKSEAGVFENETTYLVVLKYWFKDQKGHMNVALFDGVDAIPDNTDNIVWELEAIGGNTGVLNDFYSLNFNSPAFLMDRFRFGTEWEDVTTGVVASDFEFAYPDPQAPGGLSAKANSASSAIVSWADNSFGEDGYKVLLDGQVVATVTEEASYEITDLTNLSSYNIGVFAFTGENNSDTVYTDFTLDFIDRDITILEVSSGPTIDGTVDDVWADAAKNRIESVLPTEIAPESDTDYKGTWSAVWDNFKIYFLFEITDQTLVFNDGTGSGIGQDDGFDFMLAPEGVEGSSMVNRLNIVNDGSGNSFRVDGPIVQNAETGFTVTETGYIMEIAVLWSDFDSGIDPFDKAGYAFKADMRYNDDDGTNEGSRDGQYAWGDKNVEGWVWNNSAYLGDITLSPAPGIVDQVSPANEATDVSIESDLVLTFTGKMNPVSIEANLDITPALTNPTHTWDEDSLVLTISADDMAESTLYTVVIGGLSEDFYGNALGDDYTFSFTTGIKDVVAPTVTTTSPEDGESGVDLQSDIVITFSEAMNQESVQNNLSISPEATNITFAWDTEGQVLTVSTDDFSEMTTYTLTIGTGAEDMNGNSLEAEYTNSFSTLSTLSRSNVLEGLSIFPNPTSSFIKIQNIELSGAYVLQLTDISGRTFFLERFDAGAVSAELDLRSLDSGTYILSIRSNEGTYYSKKVIVE